MQVNHSTNDQLMVVAAFRYCLGRMSYIVSSCQEWLEDIWPQCTDNTKLVIMRDLVSAIMDDNCGGECDKVGWIKTSTWMWHYLKDDGRRYVIEQTAYKQKPWPEHLV